MAWRFHAIDATLSPWPRRLDNLTHWLISTQAENGDGLTPAEVAYVELQGDSSKDAGALQRCHELLA